jgi:DNA-binding MarR family transcriptional regulator
VERRDEPVRLLEAMPLMRLVPIAGHAVSQYFGRVVGSQDGLSGSSATVLAALGFGAGGPRGAQFTVAGRATHADLARRCMITPATLTGVVNTLVKAGYVRRERDGGDRRVVWLVLTEVGWERVRQIGVGLRALAEPITGSLSPEEEVVVRRFLTRVILRYNRPQDGESGERDASPGAVPEGVRDDAPDTTSPETDRSASSAPTSAAHQRCVSACGHAPREMFDECRPMRNVS